MFYGATTAWQIHRFSLFRGKSNLEKLGVGEQKAFEGVRGEVAALATDAVNFLLVALISLHVMGVRWDADEATLRRRTRFHNIGCWLTAAGITFLAAVPRIADVLAARAWRRGRTA